MLTRFSPVAAFILLSISLPLYGATSEPTPAAQRPAKVKVSAADAKQRLEAIIASRSLFKKGDFAGGEHVLFAVNRNPEGTADGYRESGEALLTMACAFRQDSDGLTSVKLAKRALEQLEKARAAATGDNRFSADVLNEIGFLHERLCGTRAQAEASYAAAVQLSPRTTGTAKAALARMRAADNIRALRAKNTPGN